MPKIQLSIQVKKSPEDYLAVDGKRLATSVPHTFRIAATVTNASIEIKGSKVGLKHVGGKDYLLTFE